MYNLYLLGPKHTFSDAIAQKLALPPCRFHYMPSISAIFDLLCNEENALALVPLENLLNGPVTAAVDGLTRLANAKRDYEIIHTDNLDIELFLGRPSNKSFNPLDAEEIYSHEQAIGQSESFLSQNGYKASLIPVDSTSAAVELCAKSKRRALAIASKDALEVCNFQIVSKTTTESQSNQTRFALISSEKNKYEIIRSLVAPGASYATSICLDPKMDRQGLLLEIINLISNTYQRNLLSISSRPDQAGGFIFYLEIEGHISDPNVCSCIQALRDYCRDETQDAATLHVFGSYQRKEFIQNPLKEITIIGAQGSMGAWMSQFFENKNVKVLKISKNANAEDKQKIKNSKYVFFSVPVQNLAEAIDEYLPYISSDALIIDNSSVKVSTIELFKKRIPKQQAFVSIHTMFGPKETNVKGKNIIFVEDSNYSELQNNFERFFYKYGALISKVSAEQHDKLVGVTQSLIHFISFSFSTFLKTENLNDSNLHPFMTPNSLRLFENISRTLDQTDELNEIIQKENPYASQLRVQLIAACTRVNDIISSNNLRSLQKDLNKIKRIS